MTREEFVILRDLADKSIEGDICLLPTRTLGPVLEARGVPINNAIGADLLMTVRYNLKTDEKTLNVRVKGLGPICRLCVDSNQHPPAGRSHKHSLETPECPDENLRRGVADRHELSGSSIQVVVQTFFEQARIEHRGRLILNAGNVT